MTARSWQDLRPQSVKAVAAELLGTLSAFGLGIAAQFRGVAGQPEVNDVTRREGEAEAIRLVTEAIKGSNADPTNYLIAMKYLETLKEMTSGQNNKVIYMPYEATGVLSSVGGIKEMLEANKKV